MDVLNQTRLKHDSVYGPTRLNWTSRKASCFWVHEPSLPSSPLVCLRFEAKPPLITYTGRPKSGLVIASGRSKLAQALETTKTSRFRPSDQMFKKRARPVGVRDKSKVEEAGDVPQDEADVPDEEEQEEG